MARLYDVHPDNPQPRALAQVVEIVRGGGLVAYATDTGFALGCALGNADALARIRTLRDLDRHHHFSLVCSSFAQLGQYVEMDNDEFRLVKAHTPGPYTFVLRGTRQVPRATLHEKKRTVGVRLPRHTTTLALLDVLGEPLVTSTLILPGETEPLREGWLVADEVGHLVDAVLDSGDAGLGPSTVVDLSGDEPVVERVGVGDPTPFEV